MVCQRRPGLLVFWGTDRLLLEEHLAPDVGVEHGLDSGRVVSSKLRHCLLESWPNDWEARETLTDLLFDVKNADVRRNGQLSPGQGTQ